MPGRYNHVIVIYKGQFNIEEISLPGEFQADADAINDELRQIEDTVDYAIPQITDVVGQYSQTLQQSALASYDSIVTGALSGSIDITGGGDMVDVGTNIFYAEYVNDGRGPVTARNKKCLHFVTKNGVEVFAKSVGPAKPRPYLDDSSDQLEPILDAVVGEYLDVI